MNDGCLSSYSSGDHRLFLALEISASVAPGAICRSSYSRSCRMSRTIARWSVSSMIVKLRRDADLAAVAAQDAHAHRMKRADP